MPEPDRTSPCDHWAQAVPADDVLKFLAHRPGRGPLEWYEAELKCPSTTDD